MRPWQGLRERKKRQTRQQISDIATGLFLERGFDAVTIAEIAEAADVSVNTVYNYFPSKEDLFFDRSRGIVDRLSRWCGAATGRVRRRRRPARAARSRWRRVSPDGRSHRRLRALHARHRGADALRPGCGTSGRRSTSTWRRPCARRRAADPDDPLPVLVAGQLAWVHSTVMAFIGGEMVAGRRADEVSRDALVLLDDMEDLLGEKVLNYARRARRVTGPV